MIEPEEDIKFDEMIEHTYKGFIQIGKGGGGRVFKGENTLMKEKHAIKIQEIKRAKEREIEMLVKHKHKNILPLIYSYKTKVEQVSIHPLYDGSLKDVLLNPITLCTKIKLFQGVLNGINYLHSNKVMHLDLKPLNIFVNNKSEECVIGDFGLSKIKDESVITKSTRMLTPDYASPERTDMAFRSDYADDIYSLGCILYEIFENGKKVIYGYILSSNSSCSKDGSLSFYKDILEPSFKEREHRISLENMMANFKRIALELLSAAPDSIEKGNTIQWLTNQSFNLAGVNKQLKIIEEEDQIPCNKCGGNGEESKECLECQYFFCSNCMAGHIMEQHRGLSLPEGDRDDLSPVHSLFDTHGLRDTEVNIFIPEEFKDIKEMKEISQQVSINLGCNKQRETQTDLTPIPLIALPPQSKTKRFKLILGIIILISLGIMGGLVWYIFRLKVEKTKIENEMNALKTSISELQTNSTGLESNNINLQAYIEQLQSNLTQLQAENRELLTNLTDQQSKFDEQQIILNNYSRNISFCENAQKHLNSSLVECRNNVKLLKQSANNLLIMKAEIHSSYDRAKIQNHACYLKNTELKKMVQRQKYFFQDLMNVARIEQNKNKLFMIYSSSKLIDKDQIFQLILNKATYTNKIEELMKSTYSLSNQNLKLQITNNLFQSKLQRKNILIPEKIKEESLILKNSQLENKIVIIHMKNNDQISAWDNLKKKYIFLQDECSKYSYPQYNPPDAQNPAPLPGFIILDSTNNALKEYKSTDEGNSYQSTGSSMETYLEEPRKGEMNSKGIYVLPYLYSSDISFYNLSLGISPVTKSQSGSNGWRCNCAFMYDNTAICAARDTGDIYKYDLANDYLQLKIASNNPSGSGFQTLLVTREKQILAGYKGSIYIYTSCGTYINKSDNPQTSSDMYQMKEAKPNIIVTVDQYSVYSHNINNPSNTIIHKLFEYAGTQTVYSAIEALSWKTGNIALGGNTHPSGTIYGYIELFHLEEDNDILSPISDKRWVMDVGCYIQIIREIQIGVLMFGGTSYCADICAWEYAIVPHKEPACFPFGGSTIQDIISLP